MTFTQFILSSLVISHTLFLGVEPQIEQNNVQKDRWNRGNKCELRIRSPRDHRAISSTRIETNSRNDILLEIKDETAGGTLSGTIMVIEGRVMLVRGLLLPRGYEIDALDSRVLMLHLAFELLGRAFPRGPDSVSSNANVRISESRTPIPVRTVSARGEFRAPWSLKGTASREAPERVAFDLEFTFPDEGSPTEQVMNLSGTWQLDRLGLALNDAMTLDGWQSYLLGGVRNGNILDYDAVVSERYTTLRELRRAISSSR